MDVKMDLNKFRDSIESIRNNSKHWGEFKFGVDGSDVNRFALAKVLQYSYTESDYDLILFLLKEEIKSREKADFQGFGHNLLLLSYLLATFKKPENCLVFEKAKLANFDTYVGYDERFMLSAGVKRTYDYLQTVSLGDRNKIFYKDGQLVVTNIKDDDIEDLFNHFSAEYSKDPDDETKVSQLFTAITLDDKEKFDSLFSAIELSGEESNKQLMYYAKLIGKHDKEIYYASIQYNDAIKNSDKVSALIKMSEAYLSWNKPIESYHAFVGVSPLLNDDSCKELGYYRFAVHQWFKISLALNQVGDTNLGRSAYEAANELIWNTSRLSFVLLEDGYKAAKLYGSSQDIKKYQRKLNKERRRLNKI